MARPKVATPRDRQLNLALTQAEYETVKGRATRSGMRLTDYGRAAVLGDPVPRPAAPGESRGDRLVLSALQRIGNNLNQLVRRMHALDEPAPPDLGPLLQELRKILARSFSRDR